MSSPSIPKFEESHFEACLTAIEQKRKLTTEEWDVLYVALGSLPLLSERTKRRIQDIKASVSQDNPTLYHSFFPPQMTRSSTVEESDWSFLADPPPQKKSEPQGSPPIKEVTPSPVTEGQHSVLKLKAKRIEILWHCGGSLYRHYHPLIPLFFSAWLSELSFAFPCAPKVAIKGKPLATMALTELLKGFCKTLNEVIKEEALRKEFAEELLAATPIEPKWQSSAKILGEHYLPEVLLALAEAFIRELEQKKSESFVAETLALLKIVEKPHEMGVKLLEILLRYQMAKPLEVALEVFLKKLAEPSFTKILFPELMETFLQIFFPEPLPLGDQAKKCILAALSNLHRFWSKINLGKRLIAEKKVPDDALINWLLQDLCMRGKIYFDTYSSNEDLIEMSLNRKLQEVGKKLALPDSIFITTLLQALFKHLWNTHSLNLIVLRALHLKSTESSSPLPKAMLDPEFSKALDRIVHQLAEEILKFEFNATFMKHGAKFIPFVGDQLQLKILELCHSGDTLLPRLKEFFYLNDEAAFDLQASEEVIRLKAQQAIIEKPDLLNARLKETLPLLVPTAPLLNLIQKSYQLLAQPRMMPLFALYLLEEGQ